MTQKPLPDWTTLTFSYTETDFIYRALGDAERDPVWSPGRIEPSGAIAVSPAAAVAAIAVGFAVCFAFSSQIYLVLLHPFEVAARLLEVRKHNASVSFPTLVINGKVVVGFNKEKIDEALKQ